MARAATTGRLRIGDEWNAIALLARTQSNPLKAVAELVENALDAKARTVEIVRARKGGRLMLVVADDGEGVRLAPEGAPDFRYVATHICDSMKRYLTEREGVHGEFGIGLLGFWSLGEELRLSSRGADGQTWEMIMKRGEPRYRVLPLRNALPMPGAEVAIFDLLPTTRTLLTGEKLDRYLATELRDRIRQRGATVRIVDRVARKTFTVRPREFEGEPVDLVRRISVPGFGEATVELHYRIPPEGEALSVYVCRDGTRVLHDLRLLGDFERAPWTLNRLEGVIDCPAIAVAPGTREGVVPDLASAALIESIRGIESVLAEFIRKREEAEAEKASEDLLRDVQRALISALRQIPDSGYHLFDVGAERGTAGESEAREPEPDLLAGPLVEARISPEAPRVAPHDMRHVTARALDARGVEVLSGLEYAWEIDGDAARLEGSGRRASLIGVRAGESKIRVKIRQGDRDAAAEACVVVAEKEPLIGDGNGNGRGRGLPTYRLVASPGEPWRSRYSLAGAVEINSAHRDYLGARGKLKTLCRYIAKLYAKEVILMNFPELGAGASLDRMVELLTRMEERL